MKVYIVGEQSYMQMGMTLHKVFSSMEKAEAYKAQAEAKLKADGREPEYDDYGLMYGTEMFIIEQEMD